jgi:hypothetical protein
MILKRRIVLGLKSAHGPRLAGEAGPRAVARRPATWPSSQLSPTGSAARRAERAHALVTTHGAPRVAQSPAARLRVRSSGSGGWNTGTLRGTCRTTRGWRGHTGEVARRWGGGV